MINALKKKKIKKIEIEKILDKRLEIMNYYIVNIIEILLIKKMNNYLITLKNIY